MKIQSIKQRRDGKFAVAIEFERDLKTLHKVYDQSQLDRLKADIAQREQDFAPDGGPWIDREPNRPTPHGENGWRYHYPQ